MKKTSFDNINYAASCLNHMKHGSTSKSLFINGEDPSEYAALLESAFEQFQPFSHHDAGIVSNCVHDQWILCRRKRAADTAEAELSANKPDPSQWTEQDFACMTRFHRYKTEASREYDRSLNSLKSIKKLHREEERWQFHLEAEKQKLAIHIERFQIWKERNTPPEEPPMPDFSAPPEPPPGHNTVMQTVFIGEEKGKAHIYEITPTNDDLLKAMKETNNVVRTYHFIGPVPAEYQHLLNDEVYTFGKCCSVNHTYTFEEWCTLTEFE